jgi:hypothetical protein
MIEWKDVNKELPKEYLENCKVKYSDGEVCDAEYFKESEHFQVYGGHCYTIRKKDNWKEYNVDKGVWTDGKITHWSLDLEYKTIEERNKINKPKE